MIPKKELSKIIPNLPESAEDLLNKIFHFDPILRPTINEILNHPFLANSLAQKNQQIPKPLVDEAIDEKFSIVHYKLLI